MHQVTIRGKYQDILTSLGDLETVVDDALRRYVLERASDRMEHCKAEITRMKSRYGISCETFRQRIARDETFLNRLDREHPTWEADFNRWETYAEELERWRKRTHDILMV